jgi:hypothetical protein
MALQITITGNELNDYLRVDPGNDGVTITMLLETAKNEALQFLNTDFSTTVVNEDGTTTTTENESPIEVKTWVFNRVAELYENRGVRITPNFDMIQPLRVYPFKGV